ncbi:MAG: hypothetical protein Q3X49_07400, partial [Slackia sp.]|uniref:hypothetical protein n=1 Tax=Slackia sp. TaxID=2049041 RepID=UPI0028510EBF
RPVSTGYTGQSAIGPERSEGRRLEALAGIQGLYPKSKPPAMRVVLISAFVYRILKWILHKAKANRENRPGATMPVRSIQIIEVLASG